MFDSALSRPKYSIGATQCVADRHWRHTNQTTTLLIEVHPYVEFTWIVQSTDNDVTVKSCGYIEEPKMDTEQLCIKITTSASSLLDLR